VTVNPPDPARTVDASFECACEVAIEAVELWQQAAMLWKERALRAEARLSEFEVEQ
jgi:hypothetical protein